MIDQHTLAGLILLLLLGGLSFLCFYTAVKDLKRGGVTYYEDGGIGPFVSKEKYPRHFWFDIGFRLFGGICLLIIGILFFYYSL